MIYFARAADTGNIKIGFTDGEVSSRLSSLQTGNPSAIRLLGVVPGDREYERCLHEQFDYFRVKGEWFRAEPFVLHYIALCCQMELNRELIRSPELTWDRFDKIEYGAVYDWLLAGKNFDTVSGRYRLQFDCYANGNLLGWIADRTTASCRWFLFVRGIKIFKCIEPVPSLLLYERLISDGANGDELNGFFNNFAHRSGVLGFRDRDQFFIGV